VRLAEILSGSLQAAARVALGFRAGTQAPLTPDVHRRLATAIEGISEFQTLIDHALADIPRFHPDAETKKLAKLGLDLHRLDCTDEVRAFLQRSGCYRELWNGTLPDADTVEAALLEETRPAKCEVTHLIPLDGLDLSHGQTVDFGAGRILSLTEAQWNEFFEADVYSAPNTAELSNLGALEIKTTEPIDSFVPSSLPFPWEAPLTTITKLAGHWIAYVSLWTRESVRPIALYSKPQTRLALPPVRQVSVASPTWIPEPAGEEGAEEEMRPLFSVSVEDTAALGSFMSELEAGRSAATKHGPRLDTALRWFLRTTDSTFGIEDFSLGIPDSLYEDLIVDSFTALEALLLQKKEWDKGNKISARAAALIAQTDAEIPAVEKKVREAYDFRNDIVHGDVQPGSAELERAARELRLWLRQVLVATLRLGGDQSRLVAGITDAEVKAQNRALVPVYKV
jgi:Apea-like HEPN